MAPILFHIQILRVLFPAIKDTKRAQIVNYTCPLPAVPIAPLYLRGVRFFFFFLTPYQMSLGVLRFFSQLFSVGPKLIYQVKTCSKRGLKKIKIFLSRAILELTLQFISKLNYY